MADPRTRIVYCEADSFLGVVPEYYNNGDLGVFAGGKILSPGVTPVKQIDLYNIVYGTYSHGYGELVNNISQHSGCSDNVNGYFGGWTDDIPNDGIIDKFEFYNGASVADRWGDLRSTMSETTAVSDGILGIWCGGYYDDPSIMQYITLATGGYCGDYGNLRTSLQGAGGAANDVYGVIVGGYTLYVDVYVEEISKINFSSLSNASDGGDLVTPREGLEGTSDNIVGMFAGGYNGSIDETYSQVDLFNINLGYKVIGYGDLSIARTWFAGCGNNTTAIFGGGSYLVGGTTYYLSSIESVEYASTEVVNDFGDLENATRFLASASGAGGQSNPIPIFPSGNTTPITPDIPCYKGLFLGGEFDGDYSFKINIKSAASSQLYNSLLRDAAFGSRATSNGVIALHGTGVYYACYGEGCLDTIDIASETGGTFWGEIQARILNSACSNNIISLWAGSDVFGGIPYPINYSIDTMAFDTATAVLDWGTLTDTHDYGTAASDNTLAVIGPCDINYSPGRSNYDVITFASGGNASNFGDTSIGYYDCNSVNDTSKVIIWGGYGIDLDTGDWTAYADRMESFLFSTGANSSFFGNISGRELSGSCSDGITGVMGTGYDGGYYIQYDQVTIATEGNATFFGDLGNGWDRHHNYACTAGGCSEPQIPIADCEDTTIFSLYSYVTFDTFDIDSNMEDINLFSIEDTDVDIELKRISVSYNIDPSVNTLRTLNIYNSVFNVSKPLIYFNIPDITLDTLILNTQGIYFDDAFSVCSIDKSRVYKLDMDINITRNEIDPLDVTGIEITDSYVKEMNITRTDYYD